jgi:dihydroorotate dehydrogenase (NAD+) catalytic subunit
VSDKSFHRELSYLFYSSTVLITLHASNSLPGAYVKIEGYWLASGILGVTPSIMKRVSNLGADAVVTKSIGPLPRKGYPGPILTTSHNGLLNAVGLTNPGIDAFNDEMDSLRKTGVPVVLSIFGNTIDDVMRVANKSNALKPTAIELNLSCPHAEIGQIAHDPDLTYEYVRAVKDVVSCPVFPKLTPNASDIVEVGRAAEKAGADAIVAVNTLRAMKIDIFQRRPVLGHKVGGLSGPPIFPVAVRCVHDLYHNLSVPIIGVGGVSSWQDAIEMHLAGASAIQIGTGVLEKMDIFNDIKQGVNAYLKDEGFSSMKEIIGLAGRD